MILGTYAIPAAPTLERSGLPFGKLDYLSWVKSEPFGRFNLAGSAVPALPLQEFGPVEGTEPAPMNVPGPAELIAAIARRYGVPPDHVATAQGASGANFLAMATLLRPGDEVLVEAPAYEPLHKIPEALGCKVRRIRRSFEEDFRLDPETVRSVVSRRTRLIVISNLHNPSGVATSPSVLEAIGWIARDVGARVLVDEVYLEFICADRPWTAANLGPHFIATSSLTKVWGLGGLRCGWLIAEPHIVRRAKEINDFIGVVGVAAGEALSAAAFSRLSSFWKRTERIVAHNRAILDAALNEEPRLSVVRPDGGVICFPKLVGTSDAGPFLAHLREQHEVSLVPGSFFEMPDHFRLGFGGSPDILREGLRRISLLASPEKPTGTTHGR